MISASIAFALILVLIFLRVPVAIALAIVGTAGLWYEMGQAPAMTLVGMSAQASTMVYSVSVLPLFLLMGNLIAEAGISTRLFHAAQLFLGRRRGGLAMATIVACGGFGAICGSSVATAATMARVALPPMRQLGYDDRLSTAVLAAGGTLGILIPPSIIMIIYAVATQSHIGMLFAGAILPGLLGVLGYIAAVKWFVWRNPAAAPPAEGASRAERLTALYGIWPVLALFGVVMGGIYSGFFTATESAGIGAVGALFFALASGNLSLRRIWQIIVETAIASTALLAILFGAFVFVEFINLTGVHKGIESFVSAAGIPPVVVISIMVLIYILLGCFLETISMMLITIPIFFPIVIGLGYDPVWFGLLVVIVAEVGLITPPIGINLFVIKSMAPDIRIQSIFSGVVPFIVADLVRVTIIVLFPGIVLWLPGLLF